MNNTCDSTTIEILRRVVGMRLERIAARRYPSYLAYSQIAVAFAEDLSIHLDLADETIAPKFEVFVARARIGEPPTVGPEWDRFEFGDFVVANVFVLRRKEWIEQATKVAYQPIGQHGVEQRFGPVDDRKETHEAVIVDSGIRVVSTRGAELSFEADTFPSVLQFRFEVASSPLPPPSTIAIDEYRTL